MVLDPGADFLSLMESTTEKRANERQTGSPGSLLYHVLAYYTLSVQFQPANFLFLCLVVPPMGLLLMVS